MKKTHGCQRVLDVGCGNGELGLMLALDGHGVTGIDPSNECIAEARARANSEGIRFVCTSFECFEVEGPFDAIVFVASIHRMDMEKTIARAKELLDMLCQSGAETPRWWQNVLVGEGDPLYRELGTI